MEMIIGTDEGPIALLKCMRASSTKHENDAYLDGPHIVRLVVLLIHSHWSRPVWSGTVNLLGVESEDIFEINILHNLTNGF